MNVISLFSGCGGLDLGFERAGFKYCFLFYKWCLKRYVKGLLPISFIKHYRGISNR